MFKVLPYLVSTVVEVQWNTNCVCVYVCVCVAHNNKNIFLKLLDIEPHDHSEEDGGHMDLDAQRKGKCAVIKTSTRQVWNFALVFEGIVSIFLAFLFSDLLPASNWTG